MAMERNENRDKNNVRNIKYKEVNRKISRKIERNLNMNMEKDVNMEMQRNIQDEGKGNILRKHLRKCAEEISSRRS